MRKQKRVSIEEASPCADYFSFNFDAFDLHETWKHNTKQKDKGLENGRRYIQPN
jgi:hypothetical protein